MDTKKFVEICGREFSFLKKVFGIKMVDTNMRDSGVEIIFKNDTTGVRVWYEYREFFVFVYICQLVNGNLVVPSGEMEPSTKLYCYDLGDLVTIKSSETANPAYQFNTLQNAETLETIVHIQAQNLKNYAKDILAGDFSTFCQLDKVVKERARKAAFQKWGEQAIAYGW